MLLHLQSRSVSGSLWPKSEARFREARIEDRTADGRLVRSYRSNAGISVLRRNMLQAEAKNLQDGLLNHSVLDIGNAQVTFRAIRFGNGFPPSR